MVHAFKKILISKARSNKKESDCVTCILQHDLQDRIAAPQTKYTK